MKRHVSGTEFTVEVQRAPQGFSIPRIVVTDNGETFATPITLLEIPGSPDEIARAVREALLLGYSAGLRSSVEALGDLQHAAARDSDAVARQIEPEEAKR